MVRGSPVRAPFQRSMQVEVKNQTKQEAYQTAHALTARQVEMILAGGLINLFLHPPGDGVNHP